MADDRQKGFSKESHVGEVRQEESDDFIIIDVEKTTTTSNTTTPNSTRKQPAHKVKETGQTSESSSVDSGLDMEDYVEVTYDDVELEASPLTVAHL